MSRGAIVLIRFGIYIAGATMTVVGLAMMFGTGAALIGAGSALALSVILK